MSRVQGAAPVQNMRQNALSLGWKVNHDKERSWQIQWQTSYQLSHCFHPACGGSNNYDVVTGHLSLFNRMVQEYLFH
jgi:hypothetical protein